jgi:hypothetical protein
VGIDGAAEFVFPFTVSPSFSAVTNNHVSAIWYSGGTQLTSWTKVTQTGSGFAVVQASPSVSSFSFDEASVQNDGVEVQTLHLSFRNGDPVDEVRFIINRPGHSENGRSYSGYFRVTADICAEHTTGLGNVDVAIVEDGCERNATDGNVEFVARFAIEPSFEATTNNSVSAIWYSEGTPLTGWTRVSDSNSGFDVSQAPPSFGQFAFDAATVSANDEDVQTFRLTLNQADGVVDQIRVIVNHAAHTENGRNYDGYFTFSSAGCVEQTAGLGNQNIELLTEMCEKNVGSNGSVEWVFPFVISPSFGAADNNQVSAIWYDAETPLTGWRKVTQAGNGYNVTP